MEDEEVKFCDTGDIDICASNKQGTCFFCHCKFSKYTCPRCTASYCSTSCYKSEKHVQCSENFYRENVMEEISSRIKDPKDVQNVLRMLKTLDKQYQGVDEESDGPSLEERFANIDLGTANVDDIWNALTPDERREFETSVQAGSLSCLIEKWIPWWEKNDQRPINNSIQVIKSRDSEENHSSKDELKNLKQSPKYPKVLENIPAINVSVNPLIKYSIVDVLYAYAYVMRMFNGAPEENLHQSVLILYRLASTLSKNISFESVEEVVHNSLNAVIECKDIFNSQEFSYNILLDVCELLSGCYSVGELNTTFIDSALSDICRLLTKYKKALKREMGNDKEDAKKMFLAKKKVEFFVIWNHPNKSGLWCSLVAELKAVHCKLISSWKVHDTESRKMEKRLRGKNIGNKELIEEL